MRNKAGEIDLIAAEEGTLCFLEIKARASRDFGLAIEAVSPAKQKRLVGAARLYLAYHPWPGPCRFDVLGMDLIEGRWTYTLVQNAFRSRVKGPAGGLGRPRRFIAGRGVDTVGEAL